jgi:hypothetical protein
VKPDTLRKLSALGLSVEQIAGVLEIMEAEAEQGKEKARARWRKWKEGQEPNVSKRLQTTANVSKQLVRAEGSSSKTEITGQVEKEDAGKPRRLSKKEQDVAEFRAEFEPHLSAKLLDELVKQRTARNATLTGYAGQLLLKAFSRCGLSPAEGADMCVERNWTTIKPDWIAQSGSTRRAPSEPDLSHPGAFAAHKLKLNGENHAPDFATGRLDQSDRSRDRPDPYLDALLIGKAH